MKWLILISGIVFVHYSFSIYTNKENWVFKRYGDSRFVVLWKKTMPIAYLIFGLAAIIFSFETISLSIRKVIGYIGLIAFIFIVINNIIFRIKTKK